MCFFYPFDEIKHVNEKNMMVLLNISEKNR